MDHERIILEDLNKFLGQNNIRSYTLATTSVDYLTLVVCGVTTVRIWKGAINDNDTAELLPIAYLADPKYKEKFLDYVNRLIKGRGAIPRFQLKNIPWAIQRIT